MPDGLININGDSVQTLEILFLTTIITLLPSLIVMMTSFTRYVISFSFLRSALGTQQTPPNLVLIGIALFLTLFTMSPAITQIQKEAYEPYVAEEITQEEFFSRAQVPLKEFMLRNTKPATLEMFCDLAKTDAPERMDGAAAKALPLRILVPAFMTCELQRAFLIGLLLYIPFMLIDIVVSSTLMSMGMIMLPPSMISMPFKLLLFVTVNGWELLFSSLVRGFN
ncbi:flagellar type III secretion system pore protein FliP [Intestinimonas sp.]|uniref:flagellar type III secretion system pore protein FliP n=1 Tax=Intestinimonas sp. TaxID=1965293 RepID=UPI002626FA2C|nr:flagellar type III secretion system pore protein FliP [Intestinimonas sp.]